MYIRHRKAVSAFTIVVGTFLLIILAALIFAPPDQDLAGLRDTGMIWGLLVVLGIGYASWILWFFVAPRTGRARRLEEGEELLPPTRKTEWRGEGTGTRRTREMSAERRLEREGREAPRGGERTHKGGE